MRRFPFCAIAGQDAVKEALILNLINPRIGGVIVDGVTGSGKSLLITALKSITDMNIKKLPLNISEDRLLGSVDIEKTMSSGKVCIEKGILEETGAGILFIDDAGLLPDNISDMLISIISSGEIRTEREGISHRAPCGFLMMATINSECQPVRRAFIHHFGLYVRTDDIKDPKERLDIMKINIANEESSNPVIKNVNEETQALKELILCAKRQLKKIKPDDDTLLLIVNKCREVNAEGHKADLVMRETARAVAALHGKSHIDKDDIDEAAYFALPHRRRPAPPPDEMPEEQNSPKEPCEDEEPNENNENNDNDEMNNAPEQSKEEKNNEKKETTDNEQIEDNDETTDSADKHFGSVPVAFETGKAFKVFEFGHKKDRLFRSGTGKRTQSRTLSTSGCYIYPTTTRRNNDLAFDATIRAAAPHQRLRDKRGMAIAIRNEDIREKVRQKRMGNLLVFVVDASGSMGAAKRMTEAKGAVLSLLKDAYVKRDKVSMVTFSGIGAQTVLPPTRSVERGYRLLQDIKTGGKTPLNAGIERGVRVIQNQLRNEPDMLPLLIIITDGHGNISIDKSKKPAEELIELGELISKERKIETMVIDIENNDVMSFGLAGRLAGAMNAEYYRLDEIKSSDIETVVRSSLKKQEDKR